MSLAALRITARGLVQGVGFRPLVYRLATAHKLTGRVENTGDGVCIEVFGPARVLARLPQEITAGLPPLARLDALVVEELPAGAAIPADFRIAPSSSGGPVSAPVTPDTDLCPNCREELFSPANRRHRYPFINCTDCGPRYTLQEKIPYDRGHTAMRIFSLCAECRREYEDPLDRRFHAQAICCPACGPRLALLDGQGRPLQDAAEPIAQAAAHLRAGRVVAIKGVGGFHLAALATSSEAVSLLRRRKRRPDKPLAVMVGDLEAARRFAQVPAEVEELLLCRRKPIVLLEKRAGCGLAPEVAPETPLVGLFLPYTPLHHLLFAEPGINALVMTSGNLSGEPIVRETGEALARLAEVADVFLTHDRAIEVRCDDSVLRPQAGGGFQFLRRSRSYAPEAICLPRDCGTTLALGARLKNTVCLSRGREGFVSHHIGDLDTASARLHQEEAVAHFERLFQLRPDLVVHDLHPDDPGAMLAGRRKGAARVAVQHHHAHAASCMAEHGLDGEVLAVTLDGSGWGDDNTVWGGEILLSSYERYERLAHLVPVAMPGGDVAARQPWRMAASHLLAAWGGALPGLSLPLLGLFARELPLVQGMIESGFNSPLTSSCGRLFDAVAALAGLCYENSYEGRAPALLEHCCVTKRLEPYPFAIAERRGAPWLLDAGPAIRALATELAAGGDVSRMATRFHETVAALFAGACVRLGSLRGNRRVVLSGGVFQNLTVLGLLRNRLQDAGFEVFCHRLLPANDGGLAFGQIMAGRAIRQSRRHGA